MCYPDHYKLDHETNKAKEDPLFDWVFEKIEILKQGNGNGK